MNLYMSLFSDGCYLFLLYDLVFRMVFLLYGINKMGTDGGGGGGGWRAAATLQAILVPG